jgi:hypothetical protein
LEKKLTEISPSYGHAIGTKTKFLPVLDALNYLQNNKAGTREGDNIFLRFYIIQSRKNLILLEQALSEGFSQGILQFFMLFVN